MARRSKPLDLSATDRKALLRRIVVPRSASLPSARRARIVHLLAQDIAPREVATQLGISRQTVAFWRRRYVAEGIGGLDQRAHPGRPRSLTIEKAQEVEQLVRSNQHAPGGQLSIRAMAKVAGVSRWQIEMAQARIAVREKASQAADAPAEDVVSGDPNCDK